MYRRWLTSVLLFPLAACGAATSAPAVDPVPAASTIDNAAATITASDVLRRVTHLSSDAMQGRDTPGPGLDAAARYAADEFGRMGLQSVNGGFIRPFAFDASKLDRARVRVEARAAGRAHAFQFSRDYFVIPARVDSVVGAPLFMGQARQGITPPAGATGRPLVFFVPDTAMAAWQTHAQAAIQTALAARAGAVVLIMDPEFPAATLAMLASELAGQIMQIPMPIIGLSYAAATQLFEFAGASLDRLRSTAAVTSLDATLLLATPIGGAEVSVPNVVAVLPGSDSLLRNEYVVFSAHFDHVGIGTADATGDSIFNGADDNASGTSAVLEIAEAFAVLEPRPRRSVMFVLVSGEEKGLLGSQAFVADPPVPVSQMIANINLDMVGRNARDTVVAIGQDYSSLGPAVQRISAAHPELGLVVAPDLWPEEQLFFRSDHFSFAAREVPAIFFTTGLHEDYHKPSDEAHLIDSDKVARISQLLFRFAQDLANATERPQWTPDGLAEVRRATGGR